MSVQTPPRFCGEGVGTVKVVFFMKNSVPNIFGTEFCQHLPSFTLFSMILTKISEIFSIASTETNSNRE